MNVPAVSKLAVRDAEATKRRILEAATAEFAGHGYGGARVDQIADAARTNKRMLYYYYGSKEALFLTTLEAAYDHIRAAERELHLEELSPLQALEELVRFTWNYFVHYPEFMMLLNAENQHRARHLKKSTRVHTMNSPVIETIGVILKRGESPRSFARGSIRSSFTCRLPGSATSTCRTSIPCPWPSGASSCPHRP